MRPTSAELIERIAEALDHTVLPAITDDKWAASVLRSATTLLGHLAKRVELEIPVLLADNADAHAVLASIAAGGVFASSYPDLERLLAATPVTTFDAATLDQRNREYQTVVEALLRGLYDGAVAGSAEAKIRDTLRRYLNRRMERERDMYFPAFTGPPF